MSNYVNLLGIVYPIGSVYITFNATTPTDSIGGTWEKIEDKFLQGSGTENEVESTGGISNTIGFTLKYGVWYGALVPTYNMNADETLMNCGTVDNQNYYNTTEGHSIQHSITKTTSPDWHTGLNGSVVDYNVAKQHPVLVFHHNY